jgi:hypothetical protein
MNAVHHFRSDRVSILISSKTNRGKLDGTKEPDDKQPFSLRETSCLATNIADELSGIRTDGTRTTSQPDRVERLADLGRTLKMFGQAIDRLVLSVRASRRRLCVSSPACIWPGYCESELQVEGRLLKQAPSDVVCTLSL